MEGKRGYATAIAAVFLVVALGVLGVRWHNLSRSANASVPAAQQFAYAPPKRSAESKSTGRRGTSPAQPKNRGVSPKKPVPKPQPQAQPDQKNSSGKTELPAPRSINLNAATQAQLESLPGIGPSLASRIISYRNEHGAFKSVDELDDVKGIGPKKLADIAPYCYVE